MATIGFFMLAEAGHLNGSIRLARSLEACGHRTCFFGMPAAEGLIGREGMQFIPVLSALSEHQPSLGTLLKYIRRLLERGEAVRIGTGAVVDLAVAAAFEEQDRRLAKEALFKMMERILEVRVDLFFVDYFLPAIALVTKQAGIRSALLNVTLLDSPIPDDVPERRVNAASVLKLPVVYLCPREFDFPETHAEGYPRYYIEPSIDLGRAQARFDWGRVDPARPLLLCSFGSQARVQLKATNVIQAVIDAMATKPEWQAVLSLGNSLSASQFTSIPANVLVSTFVPQLEVLQKASIMVTHGGLTSVKECIFFGVPMIVLPFDVDQPLNASRVEHHGLGVMGNAETISAAQLRSMIDRIEQDPSFIVRSAAMKRRFREIERSGVGVKTVMELLHRSN